MGAATSEFGYTIAKTRKENHEVHKKRRWHWGVGGWNIWSGKVFVLFIFPLISMQVLNTVIVTVLHRRVLWPRGRRRGSVAAFFLGCGFETHRGHGCLSVVEWCVLAG